MNIIFFDYCQFSYPDSIIKGQGKNQTIVTLLLETSLPTFSFSLPFVVIDFTGIDIISPKSGEIIIDFMRNINSAKILIGLTFHVESMLNLLLQSGGEECFWTFSDKPKIIGKLDKKKLLIIETLNKLGQASARELALELDQDDSKKSIGNYSVYLQELYSAKLLVREKITASSGNSKIKRGYSFHYSTCIEYYVKNTKKLVIF